jgi:hypothetical protein
MIIGDINNNTIQQPKRIAIAAAATGTTKYETLIDNIFMIWQRHINVFQD